MPTALLPDRGIIEVTGPEAGDFLNRLLTNQVPQQAAPAASHAALLTPQGKVLATLLVVRHPAVEDGFLLDCAGSCHAELLKRLTLYKLRARITLADCSSDWHVTARWNETDPQHPNNAERVTFTDPRNPALGQRILSRTPCETDSTAAAYHAHRIQCGLAEDTQDFDSGQVFPHEINLDHSHGLDFHKGCYIGQEVVSRMHHRGTARSRFVPVRFSQNPPPLKGSEIKAGTLVIGQLGSSTPDGQALALLRLDRVADAEAKDQSLTADGQVCIPHIPDWALHA